MASARAPSKSSPLLLIHALATFAAWLAALTITAGAFVRYGAIRSRRTRPHYSTLRIAWEALRRGDRGCHARELYRVFTHPPAEFLQLLQIPA